MAEQTNVTTEVTKQKTYLELISQDPETKKKENLTITAQEAHLDLSKTILLVEQDLGKAKLTLEKTKSAIPYNAEAEYQSQMVVSKLNKKLEYFRQVKTERFHDALV